jgi:hypothetical protein
MSLNRENPSKSKRVRDYLTEHPQVRNKDVVEALSEFGVTPADVSNAKTHLKKRASRRRNRSVVVGVAEDVSVDPANEAEPAVVAQIALTEIDAALNFVRQVGSIDRARQLLTIIQQIQQFQQM